LISKFNRNPSKIEFDHHLKQVVQFSQQISHETNQAFDFTLKPISYAWGFQNKSHTTKPSKQKIKKTLKRTGPEQVYFEGIYLIKKNKKVQIDCDGMAQGYSVDFISSFFKMRGIENYLIELGGEIIAQGKNLKNECWTVSVSSSSSSVSGDLIQPNLVLCNQAITTSGKFSKSVNIQNQPRSHIINPQTGAPLENSILGVSVLANHAAYADALDNAFMVMGIEKTWKWLEGKKNIGVFFIYQTPDGSLADTCNAYFKQNVK
jgi:thiamine biosynthesis lipoprotein